MSQTVTKINCLGYDIFSGSLDQILTDRKILINTINQYSYCLTKQDADFKDSLQNADILLPDGIGIVKAVKLLKNQTIKKIAGADIHQFLLEKLNESHGSCFYMGSSETTLQKIKDRLSEEYPNIKVHTYSPPYKAKFSDEDNQKILKEINNVKPDVLFVGMTAPKQEKWSYQHFDQIDATYICSIGAVFDFYAGTVQRPNKLWQDLGLEWMGRLVREPKRMYKRYINYGFVFAYYLLKEKTKI